MKRDKGNHYTYDGRTDRQGHSIFILKDEQTEARAFNIPTMDKDRKVQSIYQRLTKRQTRVINTV